MWQVYLLMAQDIARDRMREAEAVRRARLAGSARSAGVQARDGHHPGRVAGSLDTVRRGLAAALRGVSAAAGSIARSAYDAASRLEGRAA